MQSFTFVVGKQPEGVLGKESKVFQGMFVLHKNILSVTKQNLSLYNLATFLWVLFLMFS